MIYLDNAATTFPKPQNVVNAVDRCLKHYSANPGRSGHKLSEKAAEEIFICRKKLCDLFNGNSPDRVVFTSNCTTAINMVLKGVLRPGDHAICSSYEHNAVIRPLNKVCTYGVEYDVARVFPEDSVSTVAAFEALIKSNTKLIVCTHASNVNGIILPIKEIGEMAHSHGIKFLVDAAQSAGVINIDMKDMNIDYLCIAPHKGLYAPMGTGVLIANADIDNTLIEGGTGSMSVLPLQPQFLPDRLESGTLNLAGVVGISAGIDFLKSKGINNIYTKEHKLIAKAFNAFSKLPQIVLYNNEFSIGKTTPVLSFNIVHKDCEEIGNELNKMGIAVRSGLHCSPLAHKTLGTIDIGTVRVCPSVFTNETNIDSLIYSVNFLIKT